MASTAALQEPNRRDRRTARTRQAIIDAAQELIEEQGYGHTTIDQIAERADVAPRTFFRHCPSKEAVLFAHFEEHRRLMLDEMRRRPAGEPPFTSVVEGLASFCSVVEAERDRFAWAFKVMHEQDLLIEQTVLKTETLDRIAEFIAERLGADAEDPRPHAWANIAMTMFGNACKKALTDPGSTSEPRRCFRTLVRQTAEALEGAVPANQS
jgi:AcrR family transcriptional regulator